MPTPTKQNKPAHEIRLNGIRATIWKNDTDKGPRFNTTFERSYRDVEEWKKTDLAWTKVWQASVNSLTIKAPAMLEVKEISKDRASLSRQFETE